MKKCPSCQTSFIGAYCYECGEKYPDNDDFSIKKILSEAFTTLTNLDSRLIKSFVNIFNPGVLTDHYLKGRRKMYMKPFQILLISNLIFFLFLTNTDILRVPSDYFFSMEQNKDRIIQKLEGSDISRETLAAIYDSKSSNYSKGLIILIIPLIGGASYFFNFKRGFILGKHMIYATHFLSFFLMICVLLLFASKIIFWLFPLIQMDQRIVQIPIIIFLLAYFTIGSKRLFKKSWMLNILSGIMMTFISLLILIGYRFYISIFSFYMM